MSHYHAVVWIDHQKAAVWQFTANEQQSVIIHSPSEHERIHNPKSTHGGHKSAADPRFFEEVAKALGGAHEILIIGPAQAKHEFAEHLRAKHAPLGRAIVAVETADHPTEAEVLAYARRHFTAIDRMLS
jgi:stalled ribosome rescue protein Dom34